MGVLDLKDLQLLETVKDSDKGKLYVCNDDLIIDKLNNLWRMGYLYRSVSWFKKDYQFKLTKDGLRLITITV